MSHEHNKYIPGTNTLNRTWEAMHVALQTTTSYFHKQETELTAPVIEENNIIGNSSDYLELYYLEKLFGKSSKIIVDLDNSKERALAEVPAWVAFVKERHPNALEFFEGKPLTQKIGTLSVAFSYISWVCMQRK